MNPQPKISNQLTLAEFEQWIEQTFIFSIPALVAFLGSLTGTWDWRIAVGAGLSALSTSLMNLYGKYKQGV